MRKVTKTVAELAAIQALKAEHPEYAPQIDRVVQPYEAPADEAWAVPANIRAVEVSNHGNVRDEGTKVHEVPIENAGEKYFKVRDIEDKPHLKNVKELKEEAGFDE